MTSLGVLGVGVLFWGFTFILSLFSIKTGYPIGLRQTPSKLLSNTVFLRNMVKGMTACFPEHEQEIQVTRSKIR